MTKKEEATILTRDTVTDYVASHASDIGVFAPDAKLTASAIQGGNVNFAFCVKSEDGSRSVFVKQAPEYVAVFGPDGLPLTSDRIMREVNILNEWKTILADEADKYLAKLYYFDPINKVFVMEFLDGYTLLDHHLVSDKPNVAEREIVIAKQLGEFMAKTHLATHSSKVSKDRAATLTKDYENRELRDIQLEFVFTKAYKEDSSQISGGSFKVDDKFLDEINGLKARYNGEIGEGNFALCHGDLHPGSVMVKTTEDDSGLAPQVRVIDPEFTIYGPSGLDVGSLLSGYILATVHQSFAQKTANDKAQAVSSLIDGINTAWDAYKSTLQAADGNGLSADLIREIEIETIGFALAEVCRTALGHAGIRLWLQFDDATVKEQAVQTALAIVQKCMFERHTEGMQSLQNCLKKDLLK